MDNSFFPNILEFKNKIPLDPQILRLKDWLSRYDFNVKHIKGKRSFLLKKKRSFLLKKKKENSKTQASTIDFNHHWS